MAAIYQTEILSVHHSSDHLKRLIGFENHQEYATLFISIDYFDCL